VTTPTSEKSGLSNVFDKIHYKNLQYSKSYRGDSGFYSLDIVTAKRLGVMIPGGLELVPVVGVFLQPCQATVMRIIYFCSGFKMLVK
jgi:hypothetical protein